MTLEDQEMPTQEGVVNLFSESNLSVCLSVHRSSDEGFRSQHRHSENLRFLFGQTTSGTYLSDLSSKPHWTFWAFSVTHLFVSHLSLWIQLGQRVSERGESRSGCSGRVFVLCSVCSHVSHIIDAFFTCWLWSKMLGSDFYGCKQFCYTLCLKNSVWVI